MVRLRRATSLDVGAIAMSRALKIGKRYRHTSTLSRENDGRLKWRSSRSSVHAHVPYSQRRGVIVPMLSSTISAATLPSVCICSIDPGVRNDLTMSFCKCTIGGDNNNNNNNNALRIDAFCRCVRRFGNATVSSDPASSRNVIAKLASSSSSTSTTWSNNSAICVSVFFLKKNY